MKVNITLFFLLLMFFFKTSFSQSDVDSLKNLIDSDISKTEKIELYKNIAEHYFSESSDSALFFIRKAVELSKSNNNAEQYIDILLYANKIARFNGNYEEAITYGFSSLHVADSIKNPNLSAQSYKYLGISYYRMKNYEEALSFHNKALEQYILLGEITYQADCYTNIGVVYDETAEFDLALDYYDKALKIYEEENELSGMADIYNNIAGIYYQLHENDKIIDYMNKSLEIRRQMNDKIGIIYTLINIGGVYGQMGDYKKGTKSIKEGIDIAQQAQMLPLMNVGYEALYELFLKQNDYKNAFQYYELFNQTKDSLFAIEKEKNIQELNTKYETEKKNGEIQALKIQNLKNQNQRNIFVIIIASLILFAILLMFFIRHRIKINSVLREKNEQLQNLNATQNRLMSIISHDLKAPLSAFYSITNSLKTKFDKIDRKEIDRYFDRMLNSSIALKLQLENMLNWAINQSRKIIVNQKNINLHIITFKVVMILQEFANEKNILLENTIEENLEIETDGKLLSIVLNNLISNAIKFSKSNNKIIISSKNEANKVILSVKDFGSGMSKSDVENLFSNQDNITQKENSGTGLGLIVSKDIVEKLGGKIWVESELGVGTVFFVEI